MSCPGDFSTTGKQTPSISQQSSLDNQSFAACSCSDGVSLCIYKVTVLNIFLKTQNCYTCVMRLSWYNMGYNIITSANVCQFILKQTMYFLFKRLISKFSFKNTLEVKYLKL